MQELRDTWRMFCAIEVPPPMRRQIAEHVRDLRRSHASARAAWVQEEKIHLTLKFFGDTAVSKIVSLSSALSVAADSVGQFEIAVGGTGAFPPGSDPRVLWIGVSSRGRALSELHRRIEYECVNAGFAGDGRPFSPHLTFARIKQRTGARSLARDHIASAAQFGEFTAHEIVLVRSELISTGSKYTVAARFPFGG